MNLRYFLISIIKGTVDIPSEYVSLVNELSNLGIIVEDTDMYKLSSKYVIGTLYEYPNKFILRDCDIDFELYDVIDSVDIKSFDIVVGKKIFDRRGSSNVEVIYTIKDSSNILVYKEDDNLVEFKTNFIIKEGFKEYDNGDILTLSEGKYTHLGNINDSKMDELISLYNSNSKLDFSKDTLDEVEQISSSVIVGSRVDLRELPFVTIDPDDAKDFDDAIYYDIDKKALYVAIADVSHYIKSGSSIDAEALKRGFSIYFPHKSVPMIPHKLSENLCSLVPNKDRYAFVTKVEFDEHYGIANSSIFEAVINSSKRLTYSDADEILKGNEFSIQDSSKRWICELFKVTTKLKKMRLKNGFDFKTSEYDITIDEHGSSIKNVFKKGDEKISTSLVEESMLVANKVAGAYLKNSIFRVHDEPNIFKLESLISDLASLNFDFKSSSDMSELIREIQLQSKNSSYEKEINDLLIKCQMKASYSSINRGHFGLGFDVYSHFTSPIRRYPDLIVHRLIKAKKIKENTYNINDLDYISTNCSISEKEVNDVMFDFLRRKYARTAQKNIGKIYEAKVVSLSPISISIIKGDLSGSSVFCKSEEDLELFMDIKVRVLDVNLLKANINVEII